ncbi:dolichyl-phosphate-mannose-protein mannosyltransferase [Rhodovulum imhoffii]|uniref:Dolichyl-phosphate-mannose-protein mannosyltransferase n=1 Tax=Rhodovulum imhoffii TaxID=365340 RepID=A0A2T5BPP9_9RHOB|nr:glycosyltransferase family 39 protein [Rhodovulum imhoffii]MBK5933593.1 hypothetical protein [Rhodovulum imhoffii]PTN01032.1 dolichyl-phosphate-mannose-protein mannosyltransferase [Rhodovulum imhoffii]
MPDIRGWLLPAGMLVLAITAARVLALNFVQIDLFVDEAQYWLWGQDPAFGYYSKPPMIGWVIRVFTELGSDTAFWIRLPGPLFHAATALILGHIAARSFGARAGVAVAVGFVTLPMVGLASILISTDTIMFPFLALAGLGYLRLTEGAGRGWAVATGVCLGLAFLSKYAAIYYLFCALLAAGLIPQARIGWQKAGLVLAAFVPVISANLIWNATQGFPTLSHTLDNADWVRDPSARAGLNLPGLAEFFFAQFAVAGPVIFGGLLGMLVRAGRLTVRQRLLLSFALPIVAVVMGQALVSRAYANWAASAYLAGAVAVLPWLSRRWLLGSFVFNGGVCVLLPLLAIAAPFLGNTPAGSAVERYLGRHDMSREILSAAREAGADTVVAASRDVLADLFYTGRDSGLRFFAVPPEGRPMHHYEMVFAFPGSGSALYAGFEAAPPDCARGVAPVATLHPKTGAYADKTLRLYPVPTSCWTR